MCDTSTAAATPHLRASYLITRRRYSTRTKLPVTPLRWDNQLAVHQSVCTRAKTMQDIYTKKGCSQHRVANSLSDEGHTARERKLRGYRPVLLPWVLA